MVRVNLPPPRSPYLSPRSGDRKSELKNARTWRAFLGTDPSLFRSDPEKIETRALSRRFSLVATFVVRFSFSPLALRSAREDTASSNDYELLLLQTIATCPTFTQNMMM
jgi:hypothetical protein